MTSENANITLRPCPMCGSQPVMQIMRQCFDPRIHTDCQRFTDSVVSVQV